MTLPTIEELRRLTVEERLTLMEDIWATFDERDAPVPDWQKQVLDERLKAFKENPQDVLTWDEVKRDILRKR